MIDLPGAPPSAEDIAYLGQYRIPPEMVHAACRSVTDWEARNPYGIKFHEGADCSGLVFIYFDPATGYRVTVRLRRRHPETDENGKPMAKYLSPYGDNRHLFFPPDIRELLADPETIIVLVESEKAALALTAWARRMSIKLVAVAMGGCWGWRSQRARSVEMPDGNWERVPGPVADLKHCNGHPVVIMLDSNWRIEINEKVYWARAELTVEMSKPERKCDVTLCDLPVENSLNGPDDYLRFHADQCMADLLAQAHKPAYKTRKEQDAAANSSRAKLHLLRGPEIKNEPVSWLLPNRIPDKTTIGIHGMPGDGKTRIALRIGADLSQGKIPFTGDACTPRNVLVMSNEDSPSRIKELFANMGGDLERLTVEDTDDCWWLGDRERLEIAIAESQAGYLVIDSLTTHCGNINLDKQTETTGLLIPLRPLAERHECLIAVVHHYNKSESPNHIRRTAGSIGISQSFRHHMHVVPEPDSLTRKLLLNGKTNLAPPNIPALVFTVDGDSCQWNGTSEITLEEALSAQPNQKQERKEKRANRWLREALADGEWHMAADLLEQAKIKSGIPERSLFRAANDLQIERERRGFGEKMYWRIPIPANSSTASANTSVGNGNNGDSNNLHPEPPIPANTDKGKGGVGMYEEAAGSPAADPGLNSHPNCHDPTGPGPETDMKIKPSEKTDGRRLRI